MKPIVSLFISVLVGLLFWFIPEPSGIHPKGWELFAIFVGTMVAIILKPYPMGTISLLAISISLFTNTLTLQQAFSGFTHEVVWLVVIAFFISRAFIITGLGNRLAYLVMSVLGKSSLGLGYGLVATDLVLAPTIPSVTARVGGIVYPMVKALVNVFSNETKDPRMGGYLAMSAFQGSAITSAMFVTAMAGNPLIIDLARTHGVNITWGSWALAAILPGLLSILIIPYVIYKIAAPPIRKTPHAKEMAVQKLKEMGKMSRNEWILCSVFLLLIFLWILGPHIQMKAVVSALIGLSILLLTNVLSWKNIVEESSAWDTFIWFSTLVTLSGFINEFGISSWFSGVVAGHISSFSWIVGFLGIALVYFYTHYFFASSVAHIGAMYGPLLVISISIGTPPELAALTLAFFSNLFGGLTHYSSGPAPVLFGAGYMSVSTWWRFGFLTSLVNIAIWLLAGGLWWKILKLW